MNTGKIEMILPQSFIQFCAVDKFTPNGIRLGAWPEKVYAGRMMVMGERTELFELPTVRA